MPITAANFQFRFSGGSANSDPNASLGGVKSSVQVTDASVANLFDSVGSQEANDGDVEYRGFYFHNAHATLSLQNAKAWIQTETPSGDTSIDIALADEGLNGTMETIANESTAPVGPSFSHPTTKAAGLNLGTIPAGQHFGIWIRRTVGASAAPANADNVVIRIEGDTAA